MMDVSVAEKPSYSLYQPRYAILATIVGSPLAGSLILAMNYRRLGKRGAALLTVGVGLLLTVVLLLIGLGFAARGSSGGGLFTIFLLFAYTKVGRTLVDRLQGRDYSVHLERGGAKRSLWSSIALSVGVFAGLIVLVMAILPGPFGKKLSVGSANEAVYYTEGASKEDARRLGEALQKNGVFDGKSPKEVQLGKKGAGFVLRMIIDQDALRRPEVIEYFTKISEGLSTDTFAGKPVRLELCDGEFKAKVAVGAEL